ncbi:MAG: hypothetical protein K9N51_13315 [Candidatus Pacebacteria bacterium]|nr:hypothetical protein [Candidatus Paceibacterota bacterium]
MTVASSTTPIAWAGWMTRVPRGWRPLRIRGTWKNGEMALGDPAKSILQINWQRPPKKHFNPERWLKKWRKALSSETIAESGKETSADFSPAMTLAGVDKPSGRHYPCWCGYSEQADLIVEIRTSATTEKDDERVLRELILPALRATPADAPTHWALFECSYVTPTGYKYTDYELNAGDIAIRLESEDATSLVIRQLYPADLALQRRDLTDWLYSLPFKERLARRTVSGPHDIVVASFGSELHGVMRHGKRTLRTLLRFVTCAVFVEAVVLDEDQNRLCFAHFDARKRVDEKVLKYVLANMNWHIRETTGNYGP